MDSIVKFSGGVKSTIHADLTDEQARAMMCAYNPIESGLCAWYEGDYYYIDGKVVVPSDTFYKETSDARS